jgi:rhodanese-related sulfurtransferase
MIQRLTGRKPMSNVMQIGEYQLGNLQRNKVTFLFLDLRSEEKRQIEGVGHWLLSDAIAVEPEAVLAAVKEKNVANSHPIVLVCETGSKSMDAAQVLDQNSYMNVFVIMGGTKDLQLT